MKFGLNETAIKNIQDIISLFPEVEEAILYGSRAKGNFKPGSDIDLTFTGDHVDLSVINKISLMLDELYLPYTFDLSAFNQIDNTSLADHINRVGVSFFKKRI